MRFSKLCLEVFLSAEANEQKYKQILRNFYRCELLQECLKSFFTFFYFYEVISKNLQNIGAES